MDSLLIRPLRLLISFDAEHFIYIAQNGYTNEKNHAFYPVYPLLLSGVAKVGGGGGGEGINLSNDSAFLLSAYFIQLVIGTLNTILIYRVGYLLLTLNLFTGKID